MTTTADTPVTVLTPRELQVIQHVADGLRYEDIADRLGVSINTVKSHVQTLYDKLDAGTQVTAVLAAIRAGLITVPGITAAEPDGRPA